ncbi:hypothetical protein PBF_03090 [Cytobacillus firmus DS1]|uniref:Uncharacterized protein n=1 Tax=Cytobacillus firmus DS1 TaxID=1307436 RepID=W7LBF7_CYTFI|nr:hypothetical protein PBF_03090 [Cytobacillus firmus DS1]
MASVRLMATIIEMTSIVERSSVIANIKLVKILLIEPLKEPVAVMAIKKMPAIQTSVVSLLITMKPMMKRIKRTYIQWMAVSSTPT